MSLETINFQSLGLDNKDRILDLGCGEGRHALSAYTTNNVNIVAVDLSLADIKTAKKRFLEFFEAGNREKNLSFSLANAKSLPFESNSFEKVICSEVLEHIHDYESVLKEIYRVLKSGGVAGISVPRFFPEWVCWKLSSAYHEAEGGHVRIFKQRDLRKKIENAGLVFENLHYAHALHVPYWWLKCLFWREPDQSEALIVKLYHRFLVWDLMKNPPITEISEKLLNPLIGKSVVMYFRKPYESK